VLLVDAAHEGGGGRQDLVDEDEDGLLRGEFDAFADDVDKLADGEVCWYQVLLLVDRGDVALLDLLANDLRVRKRGFALAMRIAYVAIASDNRPGRSEGRR
jgi:hypothetical protein